MEKLIALTDYLKDPAVLKKAGIKCNPENIDSWAESGTPEYLGDTSADDGLYLYENTYNANFVFEECAGDIRLLIGLIITWLQENDPDRDELENSKISWNGIPYDDDTSNMFIDLWFYEKVHLSLSPEGSKASRIGYKGLEYELGDEEVSTADNDETLPPIDVS